MSSTGHRCMETGVRLGLRIGGGFGDAVGPGIGYDVEAIYIGIQEFGLRYYIVSLALPTGKTVPS